MLTHDALVVSDIEGNEGNYDCLGVFLSELDLFWLRYLDYGYI